MFLLVSDDGHSSPGPSTLRRSVGEANIKYKEVQNATNISNCGTALTSSGKFGSLFESDSTMTIFLNGTTSFMVLYAISVLKSKKYDACISGLNHGPNVSQLALHSGTIGGAVTAYMAGVPSVAVSLDDLYSTGGQEDGVLRFALAAEIAIEVAKKLQNLSLPVCLNINVPNLPRKDVLKPRRALVSKVKIEFAGEDEKEFHRMSVEPTRLGSRACQILLLEQGHVTYDQIDIGRRSPKVDSEVDEIMQNLSI